VLGGNGSVGGITLNNGGALAPGGSPGTLHGGKLDWNAGGSLNFQLGSSSAASDLLALLNTLTKGSGSGFLFHFSDAGGAPQIGNAYTLITFGNASGFSAGDFSYDYTGAAGTVTGHFVLNPTSLLFVVDDIGTPHATLTLTFSDGRTYARNGQVLDYALTVSNTGKLDATDVAISETLSSAFVSAQAQWSCFSGGGSASCTPSGTGPLIDSNIVIPKSHSMTWLISVPVATNAAGNTADNTIHVSSTLDPNSPHNVTDSDTLVIFRDGFNVPFGDGTQALRPTLDANNSLVLTVPSTRASTPVDTLMAANASDGSGFRIERCSLGATPAVRFVGVGADRAEQAGEWISVSAGERLVVGVFDTSPRATVVMERGSGEYLMMLPGGAQARFEVRVSTNRNGSEGN
jgi:uncharacterized repeat protein (TIGR01451 family)